MTTIKDYIRDAINTAFDLHIEYIETEMSEDELGKRLEEILNEYTDIIAKNIVGSN